MKIWDSINRIFRQKNAVVFDNTAGGLFGDWAVSRMNFAKLIWYNSCELLTDLCEDVSIETDASDSDSRFAVSAFRAFFYSWGKTAMQRIFDDGYVVIGWDGLSFRFLAENKDYYLASEGDATTARAYDSRVSVCVIRSAAFKAYGMSDRAICAPWLRFIDNAMSASSTICERLGVVVMAAPKSPSGANVVSLLPADQKKKLEQEIREDYGALRGQSQIMVLPREMAFETINLAGLDTRTAERAKMGVCAIADRLKVPANQISMITAEAGKSLQNGGEIREGDRLKYKSFRRLFEGTFVQMMLDLNLRIRYTIDGEPIEAEKPTAPVGIV